MFFSILQQTLLFEENNWTTFTISELFQELQKVQNISLSNVSRCNPHSKEIPDDPDHDDDTSPTCPKQDTCVTGNFSLSGNIFYILTTIT